MFLTYTEYRSMGGTLTETEFNRLEYKAASRINAVTHNRIRDETPVRECVQRCTFELIGLIDREIAALDNGAAGVQSMNNDGVGVSYTDRATVRKSWNARINGTMVEYLADQSKDGVPLLYGGVQFDSVR